MTSQSVRSPIHSPRSIEVDGLLAQNSQNTQGNAATTEKIQNYNDLLSIIGPGPFHYALLLICGLINASDAVEILAVSFIMPSATTDLSLTTPQKGWLAAIIFVGMMLGSWLWGSISDKKGRKSCLIWSLTVNAVAGALSAAAPNFGYLLVMRFFAGVG